MGQIDDKGLEADHKIVSIAEGCFVQSLIPHEKRELAPLGIGARLSSLWSHMDDDANRTSTSLLIGYTLNGRDQNALKILVMEIVKRLKSRWESAVMRESFANTWMPLSLANVLSQDRCPKIAERASSGAHISLSD